ncbi:MAG: ParB/RepB/Spo0J family partition protein [Thermoleophilaceae bacterium]|nr:ParB/RepB/Spo0J family partition protein [Thermoleophilaceae bacterium]
MVEGGSSSWPTGSQPRGIGRGLAAILPRSQAATDGFRELPLELVTPNPDQPRREFDGETLLALAESIKARGLLQPIVVRALPGGTYELLAGERRLRASRLAGLDRLPAIVRQAQESERLELALIENMVREDLNPVDSARACATLVQDLGVTKEELGRRLGRSRVAISNLVRLLDLPDEALALLESRELTEGHGRAVLMCRDQSQRRDLARAAVAGGWSVRETERRAKAVADRAPAPNAGRGGPVPLHPDLADALGAAEDALTAALGRGVRIRPRGDGVRVEFDLEDPREGIELAERILRRAAA